MKNFVPIVGIAGLVLVGCKGDQTAENAIARIQNRKTPGYARVVNLTSGDLEFWYKARPVAPSGPTMTATDLLPIGTGEQTLRFEYKVGSDIKKIEVKAILSSDQGSSVIVMPDRTTKIIEGEQRYATADSNVHVVPVDAGGKLPASVNLTGAENKSLPVKDSLVLLNQGMINCPDGSSIEIKDRIAYSLFIVATPSKVYYILGKNASDKKPAAAGTSAA
jgi:hypothetical protein